MADPKIPNEASNPSRAEGDSWKSDPDTVENADREENPEQLYDSEDAADAGGITNRPLGDEKANQASLPKRGDERRGEDR